MCVFGTFTIQDIKDELERLSLPLDTEIEIEDEGNTFLFRIPNPNYEEELKEYQKWYKTTLSDYPAKQETRIFQEKKELKGYLRKINKRTTLNEIAQKRFELLSKLYPVLVESLTK